MKFRYLILFLVGLPISAFAQIEVVTASATHSLSKDYFQLTWHVTQYVPGSCPTPLPKMNEWTGEPPIITTDNAIMCYQKQESDQVKLFATRDEADAFIETAPTPNDEDLTITNITDINLQEIKN